MSMTAIEFERLHKRYPGDVVAVDDVSFRVESGQIFGFLGPNGAGKSTTIKILTTLALVHQPQVLFLDEPTKGLDPSSSRDVWSEVKRLNQNLGMTIFLTTQYLEEADELADVVAIIDEGRIVSEGSPARLKAEVGSESINLAFQSREEARQAQAELGDIGGQIQADRDVLRLYMDNAAQAIPAVVNRLQQAQLQPISLTLTQPTLDDVFLQVTGQRLQSTLPVSEQAN